jgi:hypothetical protein
MVLGWGQGTEGYAGEAEMCGPDRTLGGVSYVDGHLPVEI